MNKIIFTALSVAITSMSTICFAENVNVMHDDGYHIENIQNITDQIPVIETNQAEEGWTRVNNVAQYKQADWSSCIGIAHGVSREKAIEIANNNEAITFFFYMKGYQMILENMEANPPHVRIFRQGDAVFFSGEPWWGSAPGYADGYIKN